MAATTPQMGVSNPTVIASTDDNPKKRMNPARRKALRAQSGLDTLTDLKPSMTSTPALVSRTYSSPSVMKTTPAKPTTQISTASAGQTTSTTPAARPTTTIPMNAQKPQPRQAMSIPFERSHSNRGALALTAPALVTGGLIGCVAGAAVMMAVSVWYDFGGVKAAITAAKAARLCVDTLTDEIIASLSAGTYSTDEAIDMLRRTTLAYASAIPDGPPLVERVFREVHTIRQSRGPEVDRILASAYDELQIAGSKGAGASEMRPIVLKHLNKLSGFANRTLRDVETRNPRLKAAPAKTQDRVPTVRNNITIRHKQAVTP
nr:hypothetical protein B0A51_01255 [Rachicladosporium sp. CCFEE 5018]